MSKNHILHETKARFDYQIQVANSNDGLYLILVRSCYLSRFFLRGPNERASSVKEMRLIIERFQVQDIYFLTPGKEGIASG